MKNSNPCTSIFIEFHILQSFPVTCLNRDDVGAPKSAIVGGVPRARVSSQCWKRQVRLSLHDLGVNLGIRTKQLGVLISQACERLGAESEKANQCGEIIASSLAKDTLLFVSTSEIERLASYAKEKNFIFPVEVKKNKKDDEGSDAVVFPTCVGVFLRTILSIAVYAGLPHVRGGVSTPYGHYSYMDASSPRAWGCFRQGKIYYNPVSVFPTCVGVFLNDPALFVRAMGLPHVRGGVSINGGDSMRVTASSPRAWGCFRPDRLPEGGVGVFPTCVGVFPKTSSKSAILSCLPHVRGGVSLHW